MRAGSRSDGGHNLETTLPDAIEERRNKTQNNPEQPRTTQNNPSLDKQNQMRMPS
jgi:hypothetical protein